MRGLFRILSFTVLLALPFSSTFAAVAYVHELTGTMTGQDGTAPARTLRIGDTLDPGITLSTGANSNAVVKFEDGQLVVLAPNTRFVVREYRYNVKRVSDSNIVFALLQGGLRVVTGVIGSTNRNAFRLNVGTATIGVRGSDGTVLYNDILNTITAAVDAGALTIDNRGTLQAITAGNFTDGNLAATLAEARSQVELPATTSSQLAGARAVVLTTNNLPVVVQASARAAVARAAANLAQVAFNAGKLTQQQLNEANALAASTLQTAVAEAVNAATTALQGGAVIPIPPAGTTLAPTGTDTAAQQKQQIEKLLNLLPPPVSK